jgi:hypothetical protein
LYLSIIPEGLDATAAIDNVLALGPPPYILRASAYFLATCPDARYRDEKRAVELAKKAVANAVECEFELAMIAQ